MCGSRLISRAGGKRVDDMVRVGDMDGPKGIFRPESNSKIGKMLIGGRVCLCGLVQ